MRIPKFGRRKSSGNIEGASDPRPQLGQGNKSIDGGSRLSLFSFSKNRPQDLDSGEPSREHIWTNINEGNAHAYDTSSSSQRLSSSTKPSSTDDRSLEEAKNPSYAGRAGRPVTTARKPVALSTPGRSFGRPPSEMVHNRISVDSSHASTATPPKMEDLGLGGGGFSDFGDLLKDFDHRKSFLGLTKSPSPDQLSGTSTNQLYGPRSPGRPQPSPLQTDLRDPNMIWQSTNSGLSSGGTSPYDATGGRPTGSPRGDKRLSRALNSGPASPLKRKNLARTDSIPINDKDAIQVHNSFLEYRRNSMGPKSLADKLKQKGDNSSISSSAETSSIESNARLPRSATFPALFDSDDPRYSENNSARSVTSFSRPRPQSRSPDLEPDTLRSSALLAAQHNNTVPSKPQENTKVMTPQQFERYRQQKEMESRREKASTKEDSSEDEAYEDDDETERNRKLQNQRKRQEAHMSSYRQTMMKTTGEQGVLPGRPTPSMIGGPGLNFGNSSTISLVEPPKDEDDDEDVPLGVLMNQPGLKHKSVLRMSSIPNLSHRSQTYPAPPQSVAGESVRSSRLPPFARNLPADLNLGQPPRQRAMTAHSRYGDTMSMYGGAAPPQMPAVPGGLVGIIAEEERQRTMRRASPQPNYNVPTRPHTSGPGVLGMGSGYQGNQAVPQLQQPMASDQATQQLTASIQQMNILMQNMMLTMQMQAGMDPALMQAQMQQNMQTMQHMSGLLVPPADGQRPQSLLTPAASQLDVSNNRQRTLSMLDPGLSRTAVGSTYAPSITIGGGYAPSIAPSERSTVGLPSRYRPVSQIAPEAPAVPTNTRSSVNWAAKPPSPAGGIRAVQALEVQTSASKSSDDDDDLGWEDLKKQKEKKKAGWRLKRHQSNGMLGVNFSN